MSFLPLKTSPISDKKPYFDEYFKGLQDLQKFTLKPCNSLIYCICWGFQKYSIFFYKKTYICKLNVADVLSNLIFIEFQHNYKKKLIFVKYGLTEMFL